MEEAAEISNMMQNVVFDLKILQMLQQICEKEKEPSMNFLEACGILSNFAMIFQSS